MKRKSKKPIPYTVKALTWHLKNNVNGLTDYTISNIVSTCKKVNAGKLLLTDNPNIGCTIAEMLDDLKIDYSIPKPASELGDTLLAMCEDRDISVILEELYNVSKLDCFDDTDKRWFMEKLVEIMESEGYSMFKHTGSLAELEKIEAFTEELARNPYQLKLIA